MYYEKEIELENVILNDSGFLIILNKNHIFEVYKTKEEENKKITRHLLGMYSNQKKAFDLMKPVDERKTEQHNMQGNKLQRIFDKYNF